MPANAEVLAEVPFFALLGDEERNTLAAQVDVVKFPKGHVVFHQGDPGDCLYVIRSGTVQVFCTDNAGAEIVVETSGPGEFFGELSLLAPGPRSASIRVIEDVEALRVDMADVEALIRRHPPAAMDLLAAMGRRLRQTGYLLRRAISRNVNTAMEDTRTGAQKAADWIAQFSGSMTFLVVHLIFFFVWIVLNVGIDWAAYGAPWLAPLSGFDPFPFGLLTMVVSLEAIVLSVLVLLSQNRQSAKDRIRSDIEYEVNVKAELEISALHGKVDQLHEKVLERLTSLEKALVKSES